jgi:hypothetical protein
LRYAVRTFLGIGLIVLCATACSYAVAELLQIGTCASGGPYVSARQCPSGTERLVIVFFPAILMMLGGAWIYSGRGKAPGSDREPWGSGLLILWVALFLGIAFACFWAVWGPDANPGPGAKTGGLIVGFLFVPMGLGALVPMFWAWRDRDSGTRPLPGMPSPGTMATPSTVVRSAPRPIGAQPQGGGDKVAWLEQLERLRRDGVVTDAEFERLKAEILGS